MSTNKQVNDIKKNKSISQIKCYAFILLFVFLFSLPIWLELFTSIVVSPKVINGVVIGNKLIAGKIIEKSINVFLLLSWFVFMISPIYRYIGKRYLALCEEQK